MFRNMSQDEGGFVNNGLEISEESLKESKFNNESSTRIEITRSKYDQQKLHDEMRYRKPQSKSGEFKPRLIVALSYSRSWTKLVVFAILALNLDLYSPSFLSRDKKPCRLTIDRHVIVDICRCSFIAVSLMLVTHIF